MTQEIPPSAVPNLDPELCKRRRAERVRQWEVAALTMFDKLLSRHSKTFLVPPPDSTPPATEASFEVTITQGGRATTFRLPLNADPENPRRLIAPVELKVNITGFKEISLVAEGGCTTVSYDTSSGEDKGNSSKKLQQQQQQQQQRQPPKTLEVGPAKRGGSSSSSPAPASASVASRGRAAAAGKNYAPFHPSTQVPPHAAASAIPFVPPQHVMMSNDLPPPSYPIPLLQSGMRYSSPGYTSYAPRGGYR